MTIIKSKRKLMKMIKKSKKIFIMSHKNMDLDALGSSVGLYNILQTKKKDCYLVINEKNHEAGVEKVLNELTGILDIIRGEDIEEKLDSNPNKNLLIILVLPTPESPNKITFNSLFFILNFGKYEIDAGRSLSFKSIL